MTLRKPEVGDNIIHTESYFDRITEGRVTQLLSSQFVYVTDTGNTRLCLYREDWKYKDGNTKKK